MILQSQDHTLEYFPNDTPFNIFQYVQSHLELFNPKSVLQSNLYLKIYITTFRLHFSENYPTIAYKV